MRTILIVSVAMALLIALAMPVMAQDDSDCTHIVGPADTLRSIAEAHDTTWEAVAEANGITTRNQFYVGLTLKMPNCEQSLGDSPATESLGEAAAVAPSVAPQNVVETYEIVETQTVGNLTLQWTNIAMKDRGDGTTFYDWAQETYPDWPSLNAEEWPTAPNVPNPLVDWFRVLDGTQVPDGMEIPDEGERNYCQVLQNEWCTNVVATGHYMLYTGNGLVPGLWDGTSENGHTFGVYNVGNTDARLDGVFLQGWRLTGRFWNGDALPYGIIATHAHAANNMLNLASNLNPGGTNAGSNCSNRDGCGVVEHTMVITSGNAPLLIITATSQK